MVNKEVYRKIKDQFHFVPLAVLSFEDMFQDLFSLANPLSVFIK